MPPEPDVEDTPFELPDPNIPIDFPHFTYYPPETPMCVVNIELARRSSTAKMPKYIGLKNLQRITPKQRDKRRCILGYPLDRKLMYDRGRLEGFAIDEHGKANATQRFQLLLHEICDVDMKRDFHSVILVDGSSAHCVTFAQNLTRETMNVDLKKLERVKKFLGIKDHPRWYMYAWDFYHDESSSDEL